MARSNSLTKDQLYNFLKRKGSEAILDFNHDPAKNANSVIVREGIGDTNDDPRGHVQGGRLYYLCDGIWRKTDYSSSPQPGQGGSCAGENSANYILGIALGPFGEYSGTPTEVGMLLGGVSTTILYHVGFAPEAGKPIYVSAVNGNTSIPSGSMTLVSPTTSGNIIRRVGYTLKSRQIAGGFTSAYETVMLFSPDQEYSLYGSSATTTPGGAPTNIQYNSAGNMGGISSFTYNGADLKVADDVKLHFGTSNESFIEYDEAGSDLLVVSGSGAGMVLSGSQVIIDGTLVGASPLKIGGAIEIVPDGQSDGSMKFGDDTKLYFGDDQDSYIQFANRTTQLELSASNLVFTGESVIVEQNFGVGVSNSDTTHAITLPNNADETGRIKANAYVTYSSLSLKENISKIQNPIKILNKIDGVTFNWRKNNKKDIGFIAEDVGKHLPDIVEWEANKKDAQGLDYTKLVPILVEAIKTQQSEIDNLRNALENIKIQIKIK